MLHVRSDVIYISRLVQIDTYTITPSPNSFFFFFSPQSYSIMKKIFVIDEGKQCVLPCHFDKPHQGHCTPQLASLPQLHLFSPHFHSVTRSSMKRSCKLELLTLTLQLELFEHRGHHTSVTYHYFWFNILILLYCSNLVDLSKNCL